MSESRTEPHFIQVGDPDDTTWPLPIFVTKQCDDRAERLRAVNYARASVGLEGFKLSKVEEENARAYVEGKITLDEVVEHSANNPKPNGSGSGSY